MTGQRGFHCNWGNGRYPAFDVGATIARRQRIYLRYAASVASLLLVSMLAAPREARANTAECVALAQELADAEAAAAKGGGFGAQAALRRARKHYDERCQPARPTERAPKPEPAFVPVYGPAIDCAQLEQDWLAEIERASEASPRPGGNPATRKFRQECPDEARAAQARRDHDRDAAGPAGFQRVRTQGTYGDWLEVFDSKGCRGNKAERDACAEEIIATALAEGRLAQAEVDACRAPPVAKRSRSESAAEIQKRRMETLPETRRNGQRGAWEIWRLKTPDCQLETRVAASFTDRSHIPSRMQKVATTPGDRDCGLNAVDPPRCDLADALVKPGYERWESRAHEQCARRDPLARSERGYCTRKVIERALEEQQIARPIYEQCLQAQQKGGEAVNICLEAHAIRDRVSSSRIVSRKPESAAPRVDFGGYRKPAVLQAIHQGEWANAPFAERDYGVTLFVRLGAACPNLGFAEVTPRLADHLSRTRASHPTQLLIDLAATFGGLENCERKPAFSNEREQCERDREARRNTPPSPDGEHDARRWLANNVCTSPATTHFGQRLVNWLFLDEAARGSMNWAANHPRRPELMALFDNCRQQAGDGIADAWCGCYVRQFSAISQDATRFRNAAVLDATRVSAFVGQNAWFNQFGGDACGPHEERIALWRRGQSARPRVTACLVSERAAPERLAPGARACRYRTAWGEIDLHDTSCRDRLYAHQWGSEAVTCEGKPR